MDLDCRIRELEKKASVKRSRHFHYVWRDAAGEVVQMVCSLGTKCGAGVEGRSTVGIEPGENPQHGEDQV